MFLDDWDCVDVESKDVHIYVSLDRNAPSLNQHLLAKTKTNFTLNSPQTQKPTQVISIHRKGLGLAIS
jgi:hypothetical protein